MPDLNSIGKRFEYAMNVAGLKRGELATKMGTHYESIGKWIRGNSIPTTVEHRRNFEKATGFSIRWVETGEGEMRIQSTGQAETPDEPYDPMKGYPYPDDVPHVGAQSAGPSTYEFEEDGVRKHIVKTSEFIDTMAGRRITTYLVTEFREMDKENR